VGAPTWSHGFGDVGKADFELKSPSMCSGPSGSVPVYLNRTSTPPSSMVPFWIPSSEIDRLSRCKGAVAGVERHHR
jgi:hypothetical protein